MVAVHATPSIGYQKNFYINTTKKKNGELKHRKLWESFFSPWPQMKKVVLFILSSFVSKAGYLSFLPVVRHRI